MAVHLPTGSGATVRRLRIRGAYADPGSVQLRLGHQLATATGSPPGLPPGALLVIRELADPRPGALVVHRRPTDTASGWASDWTVAVGDLLARAARPARAFVGAEAPAVVFADTAELLACLLRDAAGGALADRWWWHAIDAHTADGMAVIVEREVVALPAAVVLAGDAAVAGLACLPTTSIRELTTRLAALARSSSEPAGQGQSAPPSSLLDRSTSTHQSTTSEPHAVLAGLCLALAPAGLPEPIEGAGALRWPTTSARTTRQPAPRAPQMLVAARSAAARATQPIVVRRAAAEQPPGAPAPDPQDSTAPPTGYASQASPSERSPARPAVVVSAQSPASRAAPETESAPRPPTARSPHGADRARPAAEPSATHRPPTPPESLVLPPALNVDACVVKTEYAGLFHLLNVAQAAGLYPDFSRPRDDGLALSPFDLMLAVGVRLLPTAGLTHDPIATLLARLAGRAPGTRIASGFVPPPRPRDHGTVPQRRAAFLNRLTDLCGTRLDAAIGESTADAAPRSRRSDGRSSPNDAAPPVGNPPTAGTAAARAAARLVLPRAGVVHLTATRIDIHLALADLPVAVRAAALDRDLGWFPAAGREIAYHFA